MLVVIILLQATDIYNALKKKKEIAENPQLLISGLTLRAETKNKDEEVKRRFKRYLRSGR